MTTIENCHGIGSPMRISAAEWNAMPEPVLDQLKWQLAQAHGVNFGAVYLVSTRTEGHSLMGDFIVRKPSSTTANNGKPS